MGFAGPTPWPCVGDVQDSTPAADPLHASHDGTMTT